MLCIFYHNKTILGSISFFIIGVLRAFNDNVGYDSSNERMLRMQHLPNVFEHSILFKNFFTSFSKHTLRSVTLSSRKSSLVILPCFHITLEIPSLIGYQIVLKSVSVPWLVWLSGLRAGLQTKGLLDWFPIRARAWVAGWVPSRGCARSNHTLMFLSLSFSPPSPLSKNKQIKSFFFKCFCVYLSH